MSDLIRVGRDADGGYLIPRNVFDEVTGCLSFGLGAEWSFETDLLRKKGGKVSSKNIVFFDASISVFGLLKSIVYMGRRTLFEVRSGRPKSERKFKLEDLKRTLIALFFYLPDFKFRKNKLQHVRKFVTHEAKNQNEISLVEALQFRADPARTIVKIDIEGGEWELLCEKSDVALLADAPALIFEFHDTRRIEFMRVVAFLKEFFWIAHLHGNTSDKCTDSGMPLYLEMTFVNRKFAPDTGFRKKLPLDGLDFPVRPGEAPYEFEFTGV